MAVAAGFNTDSLSLTSSRQTHLTGKLSDFSLCKECVLRFTGLRLMFYLCVLCCYSGNTPLRV